MELVPQKEVLSQDGKKWTPVNQVASVAMGAGQMSVAIAHNRLNEKGVGPYNIGPIMKVKNLKDCQSEALTSFPRLELLVA